MERRREMRYRAGTLVMLRKPDGTSVTGRALNISGSGVLVETEEPVTFAEGEEVLCDLAPLECQEDALPAWGTGRILRCEGTHIAVEFGLATF